MSTNEPIGLSLSDNATIEYILSDIPFFCVGLTALAVFSFFIVMSRINLPAIYLYISCLLAFIAAILDLSQILLRGIKNTDAGLGLNTVTGLIDTREVGFALAFGFRFLYLWEFVGQRPRYEPRPRTRDDDDSFTSDSGYHSASWERWRTLGFILKFVLLGSVIAIPILQIVWRIATGFSTVYNAESTLQIAVSVLLIVKLMLNLYLSTVAPWWRPFVPYLIPFMALMISTGIGTGNLLRFKFSETTLGRFLQAVETYALVLNLLIFTFYKVPQSVPPTTVISDRRKQRSSFFAGIDAKIDGPPFQVTPAQTQTQTNFEPVMQIGRAVTTPSSRESVVSRISSWMNVRRPPRPASGELPLWNPGDAEQGISTEMRAKTPEAQPITPVQEKPRSIEELDQRPVSTKDSQILVMPTPNTLELPTPSSLSRPFTGVSFASYYGMATSSRLTMPGVAPGDDLRSTDSPVYGLNGIIAAGPTEPESPILSRRPPSSPPPPAVQDEGPERESFNSFDELLRQQTELDKSIAALRLFSPSPTLAAVPLPPPERESPERELLKDKDKTLSISSGTNRSEFSLSIFPEPPPVDRTSVINPNPTPVAPPMRGKNPPFPTRGRRQSQVPHSAISTNDLDDLPTPVKMRFGSQGTQYDVTSFIGDLMSPAGPTSYSEPKVLGGVLGEVTEKPEMEVSDLDVESPILPPSATATTNNITLRPLLLSSAAPPITSLPPVTSSGAQSSTTTTAQPSSNYEYPVLKPLLLGSAPSTNSSSPRRAPGGSVGGPRRPSRAGRDGRPILISGPRPQEDAYDQVDEAEAFEKPRRPPAFT
ncbi:hypothetical protein MSAN_02219600 [Mycena sanguinolenta]|uniref:Uncharacterized protein n=1 Tax=Mycena sanguinolenta TaxID=230812 RepID=A0A8H7CIE9_9AGAR|nr:hypothetical protein MSAN_02219600 [Mycena sanguinolenta]